MTKLTQLDAMSAMLFLTDTVEVGRDGEYTITRLGEGAWAIAEADDYLTPEENLVLTVNRSGGKSRLLVEFDGRSAGVTTTDKLDRRLLGDILQELSSITS